MSREPKVEILCGKPAAPNDGPSTLDVLIRILPPAAELNAPRPPINLGLVLDRSGSMSSGGKMANARAAAAFAVEQLLPTDRVSVVIFDDQVETIVPNTLATHKAGILDQIRAITPRHTTALHAGWKEGVAQVAGAKIEGGLNRVILLSDGLANQGVVDPQQIAADCQSASAEGVSTTTMGLGADYNEDLMQAMAERGDGNYYFIEKAVQLADIYQTELKGLMANHGTKVCLGVEPKAGATLAEVLNDLDRTDTGRYMLPNLTAGSPIDVVLRLTLPPISGQAEVCRFRLAWDDPSTGDRMILYAGVVVPGTPGAEVAAMPAEPLVSEMVAIQMANREKHAAISAMERGDFLAMAQHFGSSRAIAEAMAYQSPAQIRELGELDAVAADIEARKYDIASKRSKLQHYMKKLGRILPTDDPKDEPGKAPGTSGPDSR